MLNLPMRVRRMGAVLLAAAALAGAIGHAQAAGKVTGKAAGNVYVIGVENIQYYPLHSTTPEGEYIGFAREVLDAFAHEQGYTFQYKPMPVNRLFATYFGDDSLDFKYPDNPKWQSERRKGGKLSYSTPIVVSQEGALVLPEHLGRPYKQVKSLGTMLGFTPWPYLPSIEDKSISLSTSGNFDSLLRLALSGHIDAVYMNVDVANYQLQKQRPLLQRLREKYHIEEG